MTQTTITMFARLSGSKDLLGRVAATPRAVKPMLLARSTGSLPRRLPHVAGSADKMTTEGDLRGEMATHPPPSARVPMAQGAFDSPLSPQSPDVDAQAASIRPAASTTPKERDEFWREVPVWGSVDAKDFLSYRWSVSLPLITDLVSIQMREPRCNHLSNSAGLEHGSGRTQALQVLTGCRARARSPQQIGHADADP